MAPGKLFPAPRTGSSRDLSPSGVSDAAYPLLTERVTANRASFFVYQDADSGLNHGFPSGFFGSDINKIHLDAGCIDDSGAVSGCSADRNRLDRVRGTILRVSFDPLAPGEFVGANIEEPENFGVVRTGMGHDLRAGNRVVLEVRSPTGMGVQFGVGGCVADFVQLPASSTFTTMSIPISSLRPPPGVPNPCPPDLDDVHILFTVVTNDVSAANGGTVLLDNIRFEPIPARQQDALSFPLANQTFGVIPLQNKDPGRVPIPSDQVLRNLTTIYESALTLLSLLTRGTAQDLGNGPFYRRHVPLCVAPRQPRPSLAFGTGRIGGSP